jgi:hypothetical protein
LTTNTIAYAFTLHAYAYVVLSPHLPHISQFILIPFVFGHF